MPIGIIDCLEIIYIHQYDPEALLRLAYPFIHLIYKIAPIIQPGQRIMVRCKVQILTQTQQLLSLFLVTSEQFKYHGKYRYSHNNKGSERSSDLTRFLHISPYGRPFKAVHHDHQIFQQRDRKRNDHHISREKYRQSNDPQDQIYDRGIPVAIIQIRKFKPYKY